METVIGGNQRVIYHIYHPEFIGRHALADCLRDLLKPMLEQVTTITVNMQYLNGLIKKREKQQKNPPAKRQKTPNLLTKKQRADARVQVSRRAAWHQARHAFLAVPGTREQRYSKTCAAWDKPRKASVGKKGREYWEKPGNKEKQSAH